MSTPSATRRAAATRRRRRGWLVGIGVACLLALGGILFLPIGGGGGDSDVLTVAMTEYSYAPAPIVAEAGQEIEVVNEGALVHSLLVVELAKGVELQPGASGSLRLPSDETGTFRVICDIPGHQEEGMVTELVVS